jgi:hypothetical protein
MPFSWEPPCGPWPCREAGADGLESEGPDHADEGDGNSEEPAEGEPDGLEGPPSVEDPSGEWEGRASPPREAIPMVIARSFPKELAPKYSPSMAPRMITESQTSHGYGF